MVALFKNKKNNLNNKILITNDTTDNSQKIQNNTTKDIYKNMIFYPHSTKEWFTNIYCYNKSYTKSLINSDFVLNKLIKSYCNMFKDKIKILFKRRRDNKIRYSANRIYTSRAELEHTNSDIFITLSLYNKQKLSIVRDIRKVITLIKSKKQSINKKKIFMPNSKNRVLYSLKNNFLISRKWKLAIFKNVNNVAKYLLVNIRKKSLKPYKIPTYDIILLKKLIKLQETLFDYTELINFGKLKFNLLNLNLNLGLISLIEKLYNKKIKINLIESKAIYLNSDLFSSAVALKLRDRNNKPVTILRKAILQMVKIPDLHTLITFDDNVKTINKDNVINTIKQQIVSGVRFEASGRLTKRLTAMRAIFKYRYSGSLKNIRSSFNGKSSTMLRGCAKSNSQYTLINSKTRNGTFGLKGWVSSH